MPVKLRLSRQGRKRNAYYHIVVADSRAPRDGKYIERVGSYNPNTNPATIELEFDKALDWLQKGAQPTDTCRAILSYKGVMMKKHLLDGVRKGAFSEDEAEARFEKWMKEKDAKIQAKMDGLTSTADSLRKEQLAREQKIKEARAEELAKRKAAEKLAAKGEASEETPEEEAVAEAPAAEPKAEEAVAETPAEEPKAEEVEAEAPAEEPKAEEAQEEPKAEGETEAEEKKEE